MIVCNNFMLLKNNQILIRKSIAFDELFYLLKQKM